MPPDLASLAVRTQAFVQGQHLLARVHARGAPGAVCTPWLRRWRGAPAPGSRVPAAAAQPISGGTAPTAAPTQVLTGDTTFSGVYTPAYSAMLAAPRPAVSGFACAPVRVAPVRCEDTDCLLCRLADTPHDNQATVSINFEG